MPVTTPWRAGLLTLVVAACQGSDGREGVGTVERDTEQPAERIVEWVDSLRLDESDTVINVFPEVRVDQAGGFLIADTREAQVRRYGDRGELLFARGRRGEGPGEFQAPVAFLRRQPHGDLLAVDVRGRLSFFDPTGSELLRTVQTPMQFITDVEQLSDSIVLMVGWIEPTAPRLHLFDIDRQRLVRSFHEPFRGTPHVELTAIMGWNEVAVRGDTVAAIYGPSDTVYYYDRGGDPLGSVPIPFVNYRRPTAAPEEARTSEAAQKRWLASIDAVSDIFWLRDGLAIRYQTAAADGVAWHFLVMTPDGQRLVDERDFAQLLTTDPNRNRLYFVSPESLTPNAWHVATLRLPDAGN